MSLAQAVGEPEPASPLATVLIPARDEHGDIVACLEAVAAQDLPLDRIEVIVVDGASADDTGRLAESTLAAHPFSGARVVVNPSATTPSSLNLGLSLARGAYVCRVDARSRIPTDYVRRCVGLLDRRPDLVVVGGSQVAVAHGDVGDARRVGIARALNNPWVMGGSRYRSGRSSGETDTVYLGAFRREDLVRVDGWNERWHTNQDFELNRRMADLGSVWFEAGLPVAYVPRPTLGALAAQYHRFGRWKVRYWRRSGDRPRPRQAALLAGGVAAVAGGTALAPLVLRSPWRVAGAAGAAAVGAAVIESRSAGPSAGASARVVSIAASSAVAVGWLSGVAREAVAGRCP